MEEKKLEEIEISEAVYYLYADDPTGWKDHSFVVEDIKPEKTEWGTKLILNLRRDDDRNYQITSWNIVSKVAKRKIIELLKKNIVFKPFNEKKIEVCFLHEQ